MTAYEAKARIEALLTKIENDIPKKDGKPIFTCHKRCFFSDDALKGSEELIPKVSTTLWGEVYFDALGENRDEEADEDDKGALTFMMAIDIKGETVIEKRVKAEDELSRFERSIYDELFAPASTTEDLDSLIALMKEKSERDYEKLSNEYQAMVKKFYKRLLIGSLIALALVIPLIIWGVQYVF